ncbi:MAG: DEAD/DEAH box helicase [Myxococcota bacterium]
MEDVVSRTQTEGYRRTADLLRQRIGVRLGPPITDLLSDAYGAEDFPVLEGAAKEAIQRFRTCKRDELRVASRPRGRSVFGRYTTRRKRQPPRPYETVLHSIEPFRGSCTCPDYRKSSLGVCKHLFAVLLDIRSRRKRFPATPARPKRRDALWLNPVSPCSGSGDVLEQLVLREGQRASRSRRLFGPDGRLLTTHHDAPRCRRALLQELASLATEDRTTADAIGRELARGSKRRVRAQTVDKAIASLRGSIFPHQREAVHRFCRTGRLLLADDMGLGKTVQAVAVAHTLFQVGWIRRALIVVPASLKRQWLDEWQRFSSVPAFLVEGTAAERQKMYQEFQSGALSRQDQRSWPQKGALRGQDQRGGVLIVNYEQTLRDIGCLARVSPGLVVLDEAQRIKNPETKTARTLEKLRPEYRLALTGTPLENRLAELASVLDWVDEGAVGPSWRLGAYHVHSGDSGERNEGPIVATNLGVLRRRMGRLVMRRRRHEVLPDLPSRTDQAQVFELSSDQRVAHDAYNRELAILASIAQRRPLKRKEFLRLMALLTRQRVIANAMAQHEFERVWPRLETTAVVDVEKQTGSRKLAAFRKLAIDLIAGGEKLVVFSQWRRMLVLAHWAIQDLFLPEERATRFFTGKESMAVRRANVVALHDDPRVKVLFASDAGAVGLNLQRAARVCINLELPWNPAVLEQRIARLHRMGQKDRVEVYNLSTRGSVEARISAAIGAKKALFDELFDGDGDLAYRHSGPSGVMAVAASYLEETNHAKSSSRARPEPIGARPSRDASSSKSPPNRPNPPTELQPTRDDAELPPSLVRLLRDMHFEREPNGSFALPTHPKAQVLARALRDLDRLMDR